MGQEEIRRLLEEIKNDLKSQDDQIHKIKLKQADDINKICTILGRIKNNIAVIKNDFALKEEVKVVSDRVKVLEDMNERVKKFIEEQEKKEMRKRIIKEYISENKEKLTWILGIIGSIIAIVFTVMGHYK